MAVVAEPRVMAAATPRGLQVRGQHSRHPARTVLILLAAGVGLLACIALLATVTALLTLWLLSVL